MTEEGEDVLPSISQRRHFDRGADEARVEVPAERPGFDSFLEVDVGRSDDSNIDGRRRRLADASHLPGGERTEELRLHR